MTKELRIRIFEARPAVERYAEQSLRKALGWGAGPIRIASAEHNSKSLLYFVSLDTGTPVVVQAFSDHAECEKLGRALRFRDKNDIPIPKLLEKGSGLLDRARYGYSFIAMEFMPGEGLKPGVPNQVVREALASSLARLHRIKEKKWGALGNGRRGSIREEWYRGITARLQDLHGGLSILDRNLAALIDRWFRETLTSIKEPDEFQLCHGNVRPSSVVFDRGRGASLVDCGEMHIGRAASDLAQLKLNFFEKEETAWADLLNRYFAHFTREERESAEKETRLLVAVAHLNMLRRKVYAGPDDEANLERLLKATGINH